MSMKLFEDGIRTLDEAIAHMKKNKVTPLMVMGVQMKDGGFNAVMYDVQPKESEEEARESVLRAMLLKATASLRSKA